MLGTSGVKKNILIGEKSNSVVLNFRVLQIIWEKSIKKKKKKRFQGPNPRVSDSAFLGWGLRICISNTSPADADTIGIGHFDNVWFNHMGTSAASDESQPGKLSFLHLCFQQQPASHASQG